MIPDPTDELTALPPLDEPTPIDSILGLKWMVGHEAVVTVPGEDEPTAVRFLSVRGLSNDEAGNTIWTQVHIALPADSVLPMLDAWAQSLQD